MIDSPIIQLTLARLRLFLREPSAVFWTFGFPIVLSLALGVAFRNRPPEPIAAAVEAGPGAEHVRALLAASPRMKPRVMDAEEARRALRAGNLDLVVQAGPPRAYVYDPTRPESRLARTVVDDVLQRGEGRADATPTIDREVSEAGSRYIDFLVPGLLGLNLLSGGMWGIGYLLVEMRTRKLIKRMVATPMRRSDFLFSFVIMRSLFLLVEIPVIVGFAWLAFGVTIHGSILLFGALALLGATTFTGMALLVSARAENTQTVQGLINLVTLPMFIASGVFFSTAHFPDAAQPVIRALPLTALNDSLRAVMNEGAGPAAVAAPALVLAVWCVASFGLALKLFRWR